MQRDHTDYRLLGLGARQVTFLRISVYVLGVFIPVDYNIPSGTTLDDLVHSSTPLLLRLQPVRSTTGAHLRDGFVRSLLECMKRDRLTDSEQQIVMAAIDEFKRMFPKGEVAKGDVLTLHRNSGGYLEMEYQGILCGTVKSKWLADSLFHAYVRQDRPISPKARESIVDGFTRYQTPQYRPLT